MTLKSSYSNPESDFNWMPNELMTVGKENMDVNHASKYDLKEDADVSNELRVLRQYGLSHESEVVDMGAGTGQFTMAVAAECSRVTAVDISPIMLNILRAKADHSDLSNIEVIQAGFLTYKHQGRLADIIYSRFALHHLPDFWKVMAMKQIRSMIRTGGIFRLWDVVYNFEPTESENRLEQWCSTRTNKGGEEWSRKDIEDHIRDEYSTYTWLLEPMIEQCGFEFEDVEYSKDGIFAKYVARAI